MRCHTVPQSPHTRTLLGRARCDTIKHLAVPYRGSPIERLQTVILAQRDVMACGLDLQSVMDVTTERTSVLTGAAAAVIELREGDAMVYRAVSGTAKASLGVRLDVHKSLSGLSVLEGRVLICEDSELDHRVDRAACRRVGARSMLCVPLLHGGNAVGVLKVYSSEARFFDAEDLSTLELMVGFIAAATSNAVAQRAQQASEQRFRALAELASDGIISADADGIVTFWNQSAARMFGYDEAFLIGKPFSQLMPDRYPLTQALAQGRFDALRITKVFGRIEELNGLRADGTEFPVELSASSWSTDQQTFFTAIVRDVSERKRLEASVLELARTDHLTGLLNRRAGQEQVDRETARSHRSHHALGFVLLDIDHFKQINDSAGHAGGDCVLRQLGALLRERIRATDIALRWGGEEFLIVLPDTDEGGARVLAEALRRRVEATGFEVVAQVTISLGVSALMDGELSDQAIARADSKLYSAKRNGRNCVGG